MIHVNGIRPRVSFGVRYIAILGAADCLYNVPSIDPHLCIRGNVAQGISMQDLSTACKEICVLSIFTNGDIVLENTQVHVYASCSTNLHCHCLLIQRCMSCLHGVTATLDAMTQLYFSRLNPKRQQNTSIHRSPIPIIFALYFPYLLRYRLRVTARVRQKHVREISFSNDIPQNDNIHLFIVLYQQQMKQLHSNKTQ